MAQQVINVGASPNDGQGNPIRTSFIKCNDNFSELYARAQVTPPPTLVGSIGDFAGMYAYDSTYFYYCFADYDGSTTIWAQIQQVGNITATQLAYGTTLVDIPISNGNVVFTVAGTSNVVVVTTTGANITGRLSATSNITGGNILTGGRVSATGNITGNYILGNGSLLSGLPETYSNANVATYLPTYSGNLVSLTGIVSTTANVIGGNILTAGLISATSTITSATNITGGNILTSGLISATANITGGNIITGGVVSATGNVRGSNLNTAGLLTATGNITGGNILTAGEVSATGNITGGFFQGNGAGLTGVIAVANVGGAVQIANGTSSFNIPTADGDLIGNISGNTFVYVFTGAGANITGYLNVTGTIIGGELSTAGNITGATISGNVIGTTVSTTGNITGGNILTTGEVSTLGNITAGNVLINGVANAIIHTGSTVFVTANITGGNLLTSGLISATGNLNAGNLTTGGRVLVTGNIDAGNLRTGAKVDALGNITGANLITTGLISAQGNITGSYFLGNVACASGIYASRIFNGNSEANIGTTGGNATISINGASNVVVVADTGEYVTGIVSATGNITGSNIITAGLVTATGNITGSNIITAGLVTATGNITSGNVITAGLIEGATLSASGNIIGGNISIGGVLSATGNVRGGNFYTLGLVSSAGNVIGGNLTTAGALTVNSGGAGTAIVNGGSNASGNIGSSSTYFNTVFATATTALYADLAECYLADEAYAPGTVVAFGGQAEVTMSTVDHDPLIVGVVSTKPAYLMNSGLSGDHVVAVALTGRVPCQVQGPVARGAMMVSAGNGRARAEVAPAMGTVIGKAVESFNGDVGTIEIVVGRL